MDDFAIRISVPACGISGTLTHATLVSIVNHQFSFGGTFYASGTFDTATSAHGTLGLSSFYIPNCGYLTDSFSWTSTWLNSNQPTLYLAGTGDIPPGIFVPGVQVPNTHIIYP
jgi:hypothetical protein